MVRGAIGLGLLVCASAASAQATDFGIRTVSGKTATVTVGVHPKAAARESASEVRWTPTVSATPAVARGAAGLSGAIRIGAQWGRVTSTYRSPTHNRRVGGVPNSFHLYGRAIDIARRAGVSHAQVAAALRNAGYRLIESLDEGDHSHFAFSFGGLAPITVARAPERKEVTQWGMVTSSGALMR